MSEIKKLVDAVRAAHDGKTKPLDVKRFGRYATYNASEDVGYQRYARARYAIKKHKLIERFLLWLGYI